MILELRRVDMRDSVKIDRVAEIPLDIRGKIIGGVRVSLKDNLLYTVLIYESISMMDRLAIKHPVVRDGDLHAGAGSRGASDPVPARVNNMKNLVEIWVTMSINSITSSIKLYQNELRVPIRRASAVDGGSRAVSDAPPARSASQRR